MLSYNTFSYSISCIMISAPFGSKCVWISLERPRVKTHGLSGNPEEQELHKGLG